MVGWYIDVVIGFLIRVLIRNIKIRRSVSWPVETGKVYRSECPALSYGGPVAEVSYTYTHKGEYYSGTHQQPFMLRNSAQDYASRFPAGTDLIVRVNPEWPEMSFVSNDDKIGL
jgi:hypothetical protein